MSENFNLIWGSNASQTTVWKDSDYQRGWETVGDTPPTAQQFDALQRRNDLKAQELNNTIAPIAEANDANNRKPQTVYNAGDMQYDSQLPTGWYMLCTVGGTSGDGDITFPSPLTEDASVMDGTVVWRLHKLSTSVANIDSLEKSLAESTGYGIVSGCAPTISGLTVTVGAGIVHLADGTRKEIVQTNITLDAADSTNPRIDLVYIDSTGTVAKITGTSAASPSVPALPSSGISVAQVSVAAGATTGTVADSRGMLARYYNAGIVSVKDFGAVGDGTHDDTQAFKSAISAAEGKTLLVPHGNYLLTEITLADSISDVIDKGTYTDIKPVYPKTEKDAFVKSLDMFKRNGTLKFTNATQGAQGLGINRTSGNLLVAGVHNISGPCTLYEVATSDVTSILQTYDYTTLGHANTITHCPELNSFIVDDCTDANATKNYSVINATTMVADPVQKSLTFNHNGICWDPICKVFVAYLGTSNYINFYILDKNFNLIKQTRATTTVSTRFVNGGCCYNGVFFAPAWDWYGEFSYLDGKQLCLYNEQTYELEDCDMSNDGVLYMSVTYKSIDYVEIVSCDGNTIFTKSNGFCHETKSIGYTSYKEVSDLTAFSHTGEWYFHNSDENNKRGTTDYPWPGGFLKNLNTNNENIKQIAYRTSLTPINGNDIAMRSCAGGTWTPWVIGNLSETDCGLTEVITCRAGVVTDYTVTFHRDFSKVPIVVASISTISDYEGISAINCVVRTGSISKTGFTVRITTSVAARPQVNWIAMSV